jgi:hypothetical protein
MTATAPIEVRPVAAPPVEPSTDEKDCLAFVIRQKHIREGTRGNGEYCAGALALKEMGFKNVHVSKGTVEVSGRLYWTSEALRDWIDRFDDLGKERVFPERFVLRPAGLARPNLLRPAAQK